MNRELVTVVIGRNEGERLKRSLRSTVSARVETLYVDSGSSDGSVAYAVDLGIPVIALDDRLPHSAARARNAGLEEAVRQWPTLKFVLFLDGDCELISDFPDAAVIALKSDASTAIVTGHLLERSPELSIYNRLCAYEWQSPPGKFTNFGALGGIMAAKVHAIGEVGGFNPDVIAGEDSELGVRLALAGYQVHKIDHPMAVHEADVHEFGQWWTRSVRAGHALAHRYMLHGRSAVRDCEREFASTLFWGFFLPFVALSLLWVTNGLSLALLLSYTVLALRIFQHHRRKQFSRREAAVVTFFMLIAKFANFVGVVHFSVNWMRGRFGLIEYKK